MKKIFKLIFIFFVLFGLFSCNKKSKVKKDNLNLDNDIIKTDNDIEKKDDKMKLIILITYLSTINDGSFNQTIWQGLKKARSDFNVNIRYLQIEEGFSYTEVFENALNLNPDLIISAGNLIGEKAQDIAELNPSQKYAIIDYCYGASNIKTYWEFLLK